MTAEILVPLDEIQSAAVNGVAAKVRDAQIALEAAKAKAESLVRLVCEKSGNPVGEKHSIRLVPKKDGSGFEAIGLKVIEDAPPAAKAAAPAAPAASEA